MFDFENSEMIHAEVKDYHIYGQTFIVEFSLYLDLIIIGGQYLYLLIQHLR